MAIGFRALFAFGGIHFNPNKTPAAEGKFTALFLGDPGTIDDLKRRINRPFNITAEPSVADEIYLCEGPLFSFYELIQLMKQTPGRNYKIVHSKEKVWH